MPRRKRSRGISDGVSGVLLASLGMLILLGIGGGFWYAKRVRPVLDPETNCPVAGPTGIHAVLFDRSDPISDQQAQRIRQTLARYKNAALTGLRFDLYTFEGDTTHVLTPKLSVCAVGRDANEWIENAERVKLRYETKFSAVLDQTIGELLKGSKESASPIVESLRAAAITSFGSVDAGRIPLRVTMISDMVQNTALASDFQNEPSFQQLSRNASWPAMQPQLKGAEVEILYVMRPSARRRGTQIQNRGHQLFWEQLVAGSGGRVVSIEPL